MDNLNRRGYVVYSCELGWKIRQVSPPSIYMYIWSRRENGICFGQANLEEPLNHSGS